MQLRRQRPPFSDAYRKFLELRRLEEIGIEDDFAGSIRHRTTGRKVSL